MLGAHAIGLGQARRRRRLVPGRGLRRVVVVALVGHGDHFVLEAVSLLEPGWVEVDESGFVLLEPETLPFALIDALVEVSLDGVPDELEVLLGDDVSVEAVVVGGVVATVVEVVVEPGVALVPELL